MTFKKATFVKNGPSGHPAYFNNNGIKISIKKGMPKQSFQKNVMNKIFKWKYIDEEEERAEEEIVLLKMKEVCVN
jgi:hypothetical protein